jgi:outer membrane receptor protein involved in Fe transport
MPSFACDPLNTPFPNRAVSRTKAAVTPAAPTPSPIMKNTLPFRCFRTPLRPVVSLPLLLVCAVPLSAQVVTPPSARPAPAESEEVVELSPFEVSASSNEGYLATSSLAGSRLKTDLKDIASSISVITPQFMKDTGARNISDLLVYTTSTEVNGFYGNYTGVDLGKDGASSQNGNLRNPQTGNRVRGLGSADITRNFFSSDIPLDAYNTENIEIQRGPNSILFGLGSPAGIINGTLKSPILGREKFGTELRVNNFGGTRAALDANIPLMKGTLGFRVNLLDERERFRQEESYADTARGTGALRWEPKLAKSIFTQITANYEVGRTDSSRPRFSLPLDMISNWYDPARLNKLTTAVPVNRATLASGGAWFQYGPFLNRDIGGVGEWFDQEGMVWFDPNSSATGDPTNPGFPDAYHQRGGAHMSTERIGNWGMIAPVNYYDNFHFTLNPGVHPLTRKATFAGDPDLLARINQMESLSGLSFTDRPWTTWQQQQITDPSVFDFWNHDLAGPNNTQYVRYRSWNVNAAQTYFNGIAGIEVAYDEQTYRNGHINWIDNPNNINIDINQNIRRSTEFSNPAQYGPEIPNPGFRRLVVVSGTDGLRNQTDREAARATAFLKVDVRDRFKRNWIRQLVGSHVFTGNVSRQIFASRSKSFSLQTLGTGNELSSLIPGGENFLGLHYLNTTANVANNSSIAGLGIQPITVIQAAEVGPGAINDLYLDTLSVRGEHVSHRPLLVADQGHQWHVHHPEQIPQRQGGRPVVGATGQLLPAEQGSDEPLHRLAQSQRHAHWRHDLQSRHPGGGGEWQRAFAAGFAQLEVRPGQRQEGHPDHPGLGSRGAFAGFHQQAAAARHAVQLRPERLEQFPSGKPQLRHVSQAERHAVRRHARPFVPRQHAPRPPRHAHHLVQDRAEECALWRRSIRPADQAAAGAHAQRSHDRCHFQHRRAEHHARMAHQQVVFRRQL